MQTTHKEPSYREGLTEIRNQLSNALPPESLGIFDADAESLADRHRSILKVQEGDTAPLFSLSNALGETVSLKEYLETGTIILTFYRGNWCPYCNLQLRQYQEILPDIQALGAQLIAVSPQHPDASLDLKEKQALEFEVLSDPGNTVARHYTTVFRNAAGPLSEMQKLGIDFHSFYADDSGELPVPAVFIIDTEGMVRFAHSEGGDYRNRTEPSNLLGALKAIV